MFKRNYITTSVVAGLMIVATSSALAQTPPANGTATVTVQNTFQISQTEGLDFGTLRVTQPEAQIATVGSARPTSILISTNGTAPSTNTGTSAGTPGPTTNATITSLVDGTPALFDITGAAAFTNLKVILGSSLDESGTANTAAIVGMNGQVLRQGGDLTNPSFFTLYAEEGDIRVVGGTNNDAVYTDSTPNIRTSELGAVGIRVGGLLAYNPAAQVSPPEGVYSGTFQITVSY